MATKIEELKQVLGTSNEVMQSITKSAGTEKRELTAEEAEKFDKAYADYEKAKAEIRRYEAAASAAAEMRQAVNALPPENREVLPVGDKRAEYRQALATYLATGVAPAEYRANAGIGLNTITGFQIDEGAEFTFTQQLKYYGGIYNCPGVQIKKTTDYLTFPFLTFDDTANSGTLLSEGTAATVNLPGTANPVMAQKNLNSYMISSNMQVVSEQAIASIKDFDNDIMQACGIEVARKLANLLVNGTGTSQHTGILAAATSGYTSAYDDKLSYADILGLYHSVDKAYRDQPSTAWVMADSTVKLLRQLVDGNGRPLLTSSLAGIGGGQIVQETLMDRPIITANDMPAFGSGVIGTIAFGAWSYFTIRIVDQIIAKRLSERFAEYLSIGILMAQASDSNLRASGAVKLLTCGTVA